MKPSFIRRLWCAVLAAPLLVSCSVPLVGDYAGAEPQLDLAGYFSGTVDAWGMFQKRNGAVLKRFTVEIKGRRDGNTLVLDEHFSYSDGGTGRRVWTLVDDGDGRWRGTAPDVIGEAQGAVAGNALNWRYTLELPVDGKVYEVQFDDWMFLVDRETMINRATMRKFGVDLGEVTLVFRKRQP